MDIQAIQGRSDLLHQMRAWFRSNGYLEVSTPVLSPDLIPEPTIANFATQYISEFLGSRELYLVPSPEIHMKKVIAALKRNIYQFSPCFRNSEQVGAHHNPEFTMLEYYTVDADEQLSIAITEELFARTALPGCPEHILPPFRRMTVAQACKTYAGFDLDSTQSTTRLRKEAQRLGLTLPYEPESWESTFNRIFLNFVEPALPQDRPLVLDEYPQQIVCLAKKTPGRPYRQRWELYAGGIELANCYNEELDPTIIRAYYQQQQAILASERGQSLAVIPDADPAFADIFAPDYPRCSGVALGFDRLLMLQLGRSALGGVILFPLSDMLSAGNEM
ncbi:MAG: elongation factor P--(R)-beta-lysine ligase [Spirochaetae bacterium HGW-Spirochaetae-8]|nr:MAG: elongation factor P--(R)-beta-lysine ligase [Spirochaetae bacterium HGW-Spirochaetae-8]